MSARVAPLTPAQRRQIGRAVLAARANRVAWKVLVRLYGRSARQLRRCMDAVRDEERAAA